MALTGHITVKGMDSLLKRLERLGDATRIRKHFSTALRAGAKIVHAETVRRAPSATGAVKRSLKVRAGKSKKKGGVVMLVQTKKGDYRGDQFYAAFVEYGTDVRTQKKTGRMVGRVVANRFMRDAFDASHDRAADEIRRTLLESLESE